MYGDRRTAPTLSCRFVARSRHAARHIADLITNRFKDCEPENRLTVEFRRIAAPTFVASEVLILLPISLPRPPSPTATSAAPHYDSGRQPPSLSLTSSQTTYVHFSAPSHSSSTPNFSSIIRRLSPLTPHASAVVVSRSELASFPELATLVAPLVAATASAFPSTLFSCARRYDRRRCSDVLCRSFEYVDHCSGTRTIFDRTH